MFALYICIISSFQLLTSASKCLNDQHCTNCNDAGQCSTPCNKGFYGTNCKFECSASCLHDTCVAGDNGVEKCTLGCKPGYYGSRCQVPCRKPSAKETCQKCPMECEDGFCNLGTSCVSGCVDNIYGYNCTCNTTAGCHPECGDNCTETSHVEASNCKTKQHCSSCDESGLCLSGCDEGFYGKQCNMKCSVGCSEDTCVAGDNGVEKCTLGCKPGNYGSRCEVPCRKPSADETCRKCPMDCEDGFCDLGTSCVSGCVDNYYGYNKTVGCHVGCGDNCTETSHGNGKTTNCTIKQHCSSCDNAGLCLLECHAGFYGKECNKNCSSGCSEDVCTDGVNGVDNCTLGCKPGYYGSRCQVPCREPSVDETCQKCPVECEDGFCYLETSCVSGCVNNYYGYNRTAGCHSGCQENCTETNSAKVHTWAMLTFGAAVGSLVLLAILVLASSRLIQLIKQSGDQPTRSMLGETVSMDGTGDNVEPRTCVIGSYIHAIDDSYVEFNEEYLA